MVLLFVTVQVIGIATAKHTNVHADIGPAFGLLLLVPGIILVLLVGISYWSIAFSILLNAVAWYFVGRWFCDPRK
jgi:hypothetical protein